MISNENERKFFFISIDRFRGNVKMANQCWPEVNCFSLHFYEKIIHLESKSLSHYTIISDNFGNKVLPSSPICKSDFP